MPKISNMRPLLPSVTVLLYFAGLTSVGTAQVAQAQPGEPAQTWARHRVAEAIVGLKQGDFSAGNSYCVAEAGAVKAIPDLKKGFELTADQVDKYAIASALVKLGDKDLTWWDFLVQGAADAIFNTAPSPAGYDSTGRLYLAPHLSSSRGPKRTI